MAHKAREKRRPVRIAARLRRASGWSDLVIRNVSPRGMMGQCADPPERGDYVEVRCGGYVIVARVAWTGEESFGARAQDLIELEQLVAGAEGRAQAHGERRQGGRAELPPPPRPDLAARQAASERFARRFDFLSVALAGLALAGLAASAAHEVLAKPFDRAAAALGAP